jgi:hypothetical protein
MREFGLDIDFLWGDGDNAGRRIYRCSEIHASNRVGFVELAGDGVLPGRRCGEHRTEWTERDGELLQHCDQWDGWMF